MEYAHVDKCLEIWYNIISFAKFDYIFIDISLCTCYNNLYSEQNWNDKKVE